jgi:cell wall-associated NlpC family hydrolase
VLLKVNRQEIVDRAREQLGVKYHKDQFVPGLALDCVGLIRHAYNFERDVDTRLYSSVLTSDRLVQNAKMYGFEEVSVPELGDIIVWEFGRNPYHTGIYTGDNHCIHSSAAFEKVFEHEIVDEWQSRFVCWMSLTSAAS